MVDQTYTLAQNGVYGQSNGMYTDALGSVIPDSVVTHYTFTNDNNDTSVAEDKEGNFNGSVTGATHVSDGGPDSDGAYSFDGVDDEISFGVPSTTDWSIVIDINFTDWNTSSRMTFWWHYNGGNVELVVEDGKYIVRGGAGGGALSNGIDVSSLSGYHTLGYVQNNSDGERVVYLDGNRGGSDSDTSDTLDPNNDGYLGTSASGSAFDGVIANYKLFDGALTDSEIADLS